MQATIATDEVRQLLAQGRLADAQAAATARARSDPADPKPRVLLFQLFCLTGQWDRAMTQLNVLVDLDENARLMVRAGAAAVNCEVFRRAVFRGDKDPLIFGRPAEWVGWMVQAHRLTAAGRPDAADELRAKALDAAPATPGTIDGKPFAWIADADGRLGPMLEAIIDGRYYWVPFDQVRAIDIEAPVDLRDLVWAPARFTWANHGEAVGLIPTRYVGSDDPADPAICLARKTDWTTSGATAVGRGQRMFTTDADEYPVLQARQIRLDLPPEPAGEPDAEAGSGDA